MPAALLLVASCSSSQTATTQPAAEQPKGVLEFSVLAGRNDPDAYRFDDYREALTQQGEFLLEDEPGYRWFAIKDPANFFKTNNLKDGFDRLQRSLPVIVERRGEDYYILAHTADEYVMTHAPGAPPWSVKTAQVVRSTRGYAGIGVDLDDAGKTQSEKLSRAHQGRPMGVFLDDRAVMHATTMDVLTEGFVIHGSFLPSEAEEVAKLLQKAAKP